MKEKASEDKSNLNVWKQLKKNCSIIGPEVERKLFEKSFLETLNESSGGKELLNEFGKKKQNKSKRIDEE